MHTLNLTGWVRVSSGCQDRWRVTAARSAALEDRVLGLMAEGRLEGGGVPGAAVEGAQDLAAQAIDLGRFASAKSSAGTT